jgi:hypothetical protein
VGGEAVELTYERCPEDDARIISAEIGVSASGQAVELGVAEVSASLALKGAIYAVTLAIKSGVTEDFLSRTAAGMATQMGTDIHALCPVIRILCECFAVMSGGPTRLDDDGLLTILPPEGCPPWMEVFFSGPEDEEDGEEPTT